MKKKILLIIGVIIFFSFSTNKYCEGWNDGYKEGWCYERIGCVTPIPPICPVPTVNCNTGYKCGYNKGFNTAIKNRE
jgi:hypothetical protein